MRDLRIFFSHTHKAACIPLNKDTREGDSLELPSWNKKIHEYIYIAINRKASIFYISVYIHTHILCTYIL